MGCVRGVYCKVGQYHDADGCFLLGTGTDVEIEGMILPCSLNRSYSEQSNRFLLVGGPTSSAFPVSLNDCSIVGAGSPYTIPGESSPRYGHRAIAIVHMGAQLLIRGGVYGITNTPRYILAGGGTTTLVDVQGAQFYTSGKEDPILDWNGTLAMDGQYTIRDPYQQHSPITRTRQSLVNGQVRIVKTPDSPNEYLSTSYHHDQQGGYGGFKCETRFGYNPSFSAGKRMRVLAYDADTGTLKENDVLNSVGKK